MSGDTLRRKAMMGEHDTMRALLVQGSNPCSVDEYGLTALHYSVWNGNLRCVELLCANDIGRDSNGRSGSCIDMQSNKGFTALHLAASESVEGEACIRLLLSFGADPDLTCGDGHTAKELAERGNREDCVNAMDLHIAATDQEGIRREIVNKLKVQREQRRQKGDPRLPVLPVGMLMHEHEIIPVAKESFAGPHEKVTIHKLQFATDQALANEERRRILAGSFEAKQATEMASRLI